MQKIWIILSICFISIGCNSNVPEETKTGKLTVYTTFYPTAYFTQKIAKNYVEVICPVPEEEDAIFWEAYKNPEIIQQYQQADLIVLNGAKFAKWVNKVSLPQHKIVNTAKPLEKDFIYIKNSSTHSHGGKEHSHVGIDGHTWVDPVNAKIQAEEIKKAIILLLPGKEKEIEKNFEELASDLDTLTVTLRKYEKSENGKQPLLASHPAYNYVARRFGWNIKNLDLDPESMPNEKVFSKIRKILEKHPAKYIIWESFPKEDIAKRLKKELDLESIEFSPCELLSEKNTDYLKVMKQNLQNLEKIWK